MDQPTEAQRVAYDRTRYLPYRKLVLFSTVALKAAMDATDTNWQTGYVSKMGFVALAGLMAPGVN